MKIPSLKETRGDIVNTLLYRRAHDSSALDYLENKRNKKSINSNQIQFIELVRSESKLQLFLSLAPYHHVVGLLDS